MELRTWLHSEAIARCSRMCFPPRCEKPPVHFYRYLYDTIGADYYWVDRKKLSPEALAKIGTGIPNITVPYAFANKYERRTPYTWEYLLNVQRELVKDFVVTAAYVGTKGTHLQIPEEANRAGISRATAAAAPARPRATSTSGASTSRSRALSPSNRTATPPITPFN